MLKSLLGNDASRSGHASLPHIHTRPLTLREQEVAVLIAHGLTNRHIAERLVIAPRTADNHVQHIFDKLGVSSRAQVAAWAALHGLLDFPAFRDAA
jgi:DNA-binding NarL/FixJ family response regulator